MEVEEEVGVGGLVCLILFGFYCYCKQCGNGVFLMVDVDVFLMVVIEECDQWKEKSQCECCWFMLFEVVEVVDEVDFCDFMCFFVVFEFRVVVRCMGVFQFVV